MSTALADRIRVIPDPDEPIPAVAIPTLALFLGALLIYGTSTALALRHLWPWELSTLINGVTAFVFFTIAHESTHAATSSRTAANRWLGRLSIPFFTPLGSYGALRFIHMQHNRFTNRTDGSDPDHYTQEGPSFLMPLRWATIDLHYIRFYAPRFGSRPTREKAETIIVTLLLLAVLATLVATGHGIAVLVLYLIPARIALFLLAWSFDWLPHHGLHETAQSDRFKATRNIIGLERLLTPLLLYQNYHLVHHLHPVVPFYRYIAVWRRNEDAYLSHDPALCDPRGRPLSADEVRALHHLDH
jgi:ring-1,2-phenylacetyl-CoA epoxidase subunit PaaE